MEEESLRTGPPRKKAAVIRKALDLVFGPGGAPPEIKGMSDRELRGYFHRYRSLLAGPVQTVIEENYKISNPSVRVPKRIQQLFMEADHTLVELAKRRAMIEEVCLSSDLT